MTKPAVFMRFRGVSFEVTELDRRNAFRFHYRALRSAGQGGAAARGFLARWALFGDDAGVIRPWDAHGNEIKPLFGGE